MRVGRRAVVRLPAKDDIGDAEFVAQHAVEVGEIARGALFAVGDEADRLALERSRARRRLAADRLSFIRRIEYAKNHGLCSACTFYTLAFRWLAVDAGADRRRHGFGLAAEPRRDDGAKTAGRAAGRDDEQIVRRRERGVNRFAAIAHHRAFADVGPFGAADAGALVDEFGDVALGPAGVLDVIAQLLRNDDGVIAAVDRIVALVGAHLGGKSFKNLARVLGPFVHDLARRHRVHHGDGR